MRERRYEMQGALVRQNANRPHRAVRDFARANLDRKSARLRTFNFLAGVHGNVRARHAEHERKCSPRWRDLKLACEGPRPALAHFLHALSDCRAADLVLEHDTAEHVANRRETSDLLGERAAPNFFRTRRRFARIGQRHLRTNLPSGVDPVCQPHLTVGFGQYRLTAWRLTIRLVVRTG